jgi:hypothetical protein
MTRQTWLLPATAVALVLLGSALAPSAPPEPKQPPWKLAEAKLDAARKTCELIAQDYAEGRASHEQFQLWSRRWMDAQKQVTPKRSEQLAAVEAHVDRMRQLEKAARKRVAAKRAPEWEGYATEYLRIEAELMLSQTRSSK